MRRWASLFLWGMTVLGWPGGSPGLTEDLNRFFSRVKENDVHAVGQMLTAGVPPDSVDGLSWTALHQAADMGHVEMCRLLLSRGAKTEVTDPNGATPLHRAAFRARSDVLALLIERGARVDSADQDGQTPLHLAAQQGHLEIVRALLDAGANPNLLDKSGGAPLDMARHAAQPKMREVARLIQQKGGKTGTQLKAEDLAERRRKGLLPPCPGFQGAQWGMSRDEVLVQIEDARMIRDSDDLILKTTVGGMPARAMLRFFSDKLGAVSVFFEGLEVDQSLARKTYEKLFSLLEQKYGPAWTVVRSLQTTNPFIKENLDYALVVGALKLQSTWETDQASIVLSCRSQDYKPYLTLEYRSLRYYKPKTVEAPSKPVEPGAPRDDL